MLTSFKEYNSLLFNAVVSLSELDKQILCLSSIERLKDLIQLFDIRYEEKRFPVFELYLSQGYDIILANNINPSFPEIQKTLEANIPDSEEYSALECIFAQNGFISLIRFYRFCESNDLREFDLIFHNIQESIDAINYEKDENFNTEPVMKQEISSYYKLLAILQSNRAIDSKIFEARQWSNSHRLKLLA